MSIITRVCLGVALLLGVASIFLSRELTTDKENLRDARITADKKAERATAGLKTAQDEIVAKKKEAEEALAKEADLDKQVKEKSANITTLGTEIDKLKKEIEGFGKRPPKPNDGDDVMGGELRTKLAAAEKARDAAAQQAKDAADNIKALKDQVAAVEGEKKIINDKLTFAKGELIVIKGGEGLPLPEGLSGKVLHYDKTWNFAVLDIGKKKGVLPSGVMILHRGTEIVGKVRIATVDDDCCVADFMGDPKKREPRAGDMAIP